ncbi:MAG: sensor histidine kinase [Oscillospiraceae bacterium]|jgi:anti-sigma regulatory factor (Ser/Thr protein kinase)|nr:sensor histidine kinase [Oscillospiraceae bacterium]
MPEFFKWLVGGEDIRELSLNVMDVTQNSITAGARLIEITAEEDTVQKLLKIVIRDDGSGMTDEQVEKVTNPFYTTRTTRKVGLGVPFFKMSSEQTGGSFSIVSEPGTGTTVTAVYHTDHIDMTPLGDMNETVLLLVTCNPDLDFIYRRSVDDGAYTLDTRELREVLGGDVPLSSPDVADWIRAYLREQEDSLK